MLPTKPHTPRHSRDSHTTGHHDADPQPGATIPIPRRTLVELFARAASAARLTSYLSQHGAPTVERLAGHVDAIYLELSEILGAYHLTVEPLRPAEEPAPPADPLAAADDLRLLIARADALAATTDEQFSRVVILKEGDDRRGFRRLAHLVELTTAAVMDASDATDRLIAALERSLPPEES